MLTSESFIAIKYKADFSYKENNLFVVEDVKGVLTPTYKLKIKMFLNKFDGVFREVYKKGSVWEVKQY